MTTQTKPQPAAPPVYRCCHCSGIGEVPVHYPDARGVFVCNWQRCPYCRGAGKWSEQEKAGAA